ncbi:DsbC family protein [Ignatzschineria sp. RMDPL8A]|uniref:DsbC family protein n=1 Tax=Ignatzschineria sp. RMDPL8A TaxID=2999236 RepID=UPI002446673A|nr:DsbC family protein [Ignatzschineria sp. RMDPL8A]MDG9729771.1 DsbC family protein [Ignatzschineria sp. RMDPL8A]
MIKKVLITMTLGALMTTGAMAKEKVDLKYFNETFQGVTVKNISESEIKGIYQVEIEEIAQPIYVSKDGKYMFEGHLIDLVNKESLTDNYAKKMKKAIIDDISEDDMVVYKAKNEKHKITVFTDVDCPYCQMLHKEVKDYNDNGVTVRYMAYPRTGIPSAGYNHLVSVWCSDDKPKALTDAKNGRSVKNATCANSPVSNQFDIGMKLGVQGTPAIFLEDGTMLGGYLPYKQLLMQLDR